MHAIPGDRLYFCVLYEWLVRWHLRVVESHRTDEAVRFGFFFCFFFFDSSLLIFFVVVVAAHSCSGILCWVLITKMYAHGFSRAYFKIHLITSFRLHTRLQNKRHFSRLRRAITAHIHCSYIRSIVFNCVSHVCLLGFFFAPAPSSSSSEWNRAKANGTKCALFHCALWESIENQFFYVVWPFRKMPKSVISLSNELAFIK